MPTLTITHEDLLRGKIVTPGWYKMLVKDVDSSAASTDGSTNINISLTIVQEGDFLDVPLKRTFNEKAPGFSKSFLEAITKGPIEAGTFEFASAKGHEVYGFVKTRIWAERPTNSVEDFRGVGEDGGILTI